MAADCLVYLDRHSVEHFLRSMGMVLDESQFKSLAVRSINRSIQATRAEAVRMIREEYNAPARDLRERMSISPARKGKYYAILRAQGEISVPLIRYGARPNVPVAAGSLPKRGVSVLVKRAEGRKVVAHSFVQTGSQGPQVYKRVTGAGRYPIHRLYGPGQIQILRREASDRRLQERAEEILLSTALHEATALLRGIR